MVELSGEPGACGICGRSMLAGERTRVYVARDDERHNVCDLCLVRAESAGWVPAELAGARAPEVGREAGGAMRRLLGRAREGAAGRGGGEGEAGEDPADAGVAAEATTRTRPARRRRPAREPDAAREHEPATGNAEEQPRRRSVPQKPERRIKRAFESFNASEHRLTVRGLIRSLGGPYVCAVTTNDSPGEVRITIAWELSWYQYEVDLTADGEAVRELGRGQEFDELTPEDQAWNAHAAEDGELRTGLIGSRSDD